MNMVVVPRAGVAPARPCGHRCLRPTRLPVPPLRRSPEGLRPYHSRVRLVLAGALVSLLGACAAPSFTPTAASSPDASPATAGPIASAPRIQPAPVTPPTPPGTNLPDFACSDASGGKTGVANFTAARAAEVPTYDRFVLQFDPIVPTYTITRQAKPVFPLGASGQNVTLAGSAGVLISVHSATGATTFQGHPDFPHPDFQSLKKPRHTPASDATS